MSGKMLRKGLIAVLAVVLVVSGGYAIKTALDFQAEAEIYDTAVESFVTIIEEEVPLAELPSDVEALSVETPVVADTASEGTTEAVEEDTSVAIALGPDIAVDFDGLIWVNTDIVGWIYIPNTTISYPVLRGDNNQEYLDTTYNGGYSGIGSIFMDYRIEGDFTDKNTIVYGHNVSSGTMFGSLKSYREQSYAEEHPYIFILTDEGYLRYQVCYAVVTTADSYIYDYEFAEGTDAYATHLANLSADALYDLDIQVTEDDNIITLSTCTGVTQNQRFIVVGRLDN